MLNGCVGGWTWTRLRRRDVPHETALIRNLDPETDPRRPGLLAAGWAIKATAAEIGAGERTVHDWLGKPEYRAYIADLRDRMLSQSVGRLSDASTEAVETLRSLLADESPSVRLRASVAILDGLIRYREFSELAEHVAQLEARVAERGKKWDG